MDWGITTRAILATALLDAVPAELDGNGVGLTTEHTCLILDRTAWMGHTKASYSMAACLPVCMELVEDCMEPVVDSMELAMVE